MDVVHTRTKGARMSAISLVPVQTDQAIRNMADLASAIWHEYWPCVLTDEQIDYMVDTMQSYEPIKRELEEEGYLYWFVIGEDGERLGYLSVRIEEDERRLFVSKVYLSKDARGKHYGSRMLDFCEEICRVNHLSSMYLHVNKHNELGKRAYLGRGWHVAEETVGDIGHGFVMDDYIMAKDVEFA